MLYHSIYSVRDKKKVNAEVIDIREIEGAKGVRFQIVGRHPEDGTTVTTFCSAAVAEDYKEKMSTLPHGLSAESIEVAQDHIPTSEATVISTDGTPVDDDLETFVEDPLVGSPSEGTLTSAKVMAAEGESEKKNCGCGQDPCKTYGAEGVDPLGVGGVVKLDHAFKEHESFSEGHIGITTNGDWAWSTGTNKLAVDIKLDPYQNYMFELVSEGGADPITQNESQFIFEEIQNGKKAKQVVDEHIADFAGKNWRSDLDSGNSEYAAETVAGIDIQTPSQIAIETPDSDQLIVPDPDHLVSGDGRVLGQQSGKVNTTPNQALEYLKSGDNCVWLVGYSAGERDYPIEESEELATLIEEGVFEEDSTLVIATKLYKPWSGDAYNPSEDEDFDAESYSPGFARNTKVLVPTAVIGGLVLAYLAKPELLSGSLDKISSMLSSLTKKGDKTE